MSRMPVALKLVAPLLALGGIVAAATYAAERTGTQTRAPSVPEAPTAAEADEQAEVAPAGERELDEEAERDLAAPGAIARVEEGPRGPGTPDDVDLRNVPPTSDAYRCLQPDVPIERDAACAEGAGYPRCRWKLPEQSEARGIYRAWRNTTPDHRWARPGLVSLLLATASEYASRWPGETLNIGDLDAAGPRHQTHDRGVDVDMYLEHAMIARNDGGRRYPDNYEGRPAEEVALRRARVMDLAKILATCSRGRLRIYYNDPDLVRPFRAWFDERGLVSDVGPAMMQHNPLHRFHFHVTVAEDLAPLDVAR